MSTQKTKAEIEKEEEEARQQKYVRIGFQGAPASYKQVLRYSLSPNNINAIFNSDVEFLQDSETVRPVRCPPRLRPCCRPPLTPPPPPHPLPPPPPLLRAPSSTPRTGP